MLKHVIYCRKSTESEERQMLSIDAQYSELNELAQAQGLSVSGRFHESKSAKEPGREVLNDMLRRIERGEANAILCWKLDRLARNFDEGGRIIGMLQRGVIREIRTCERTYLPSDNVMMIALEFGMANQYSRDLSTNIRRGIREKVRRGIYSCKAPLGYFNEPRLRTIEPHPERFKKVKKALELFASGDYSLTALQREMTKLGLVGERSKKPLPLSSIGNLLRNPFYYGVFYHKGEMHEGTHVPMITKKTFDDIQAALVAVGKPRLRNSRGHKNLLFLDFATCGSCGYAVTGERHIKKSGLTFHYYRCSHKNKIKHCEDRSFIRQEKFYEEIKRNTQLVALPDDWKDRFLAKVEIWELEAGEATQKQIACFKEDIAALKSKLTRINHAFTEGQLEFEEYKELKNPLVQNKAELEQKLIALERDKTGRLEPVKEWIFQANQAVKWVFEENWMEMKSFLKKVGSNRLLKAQTITVEFKKPWILLAETNISVRSTNDISQQYSEWWRRGELNPCP